MHGMLTQSHDTTRSRDREVSNLLHLCGDLALAITCESCGAVCTRTGAWLAAHPTFMCGRCFQDTSVRLNALIQAVQTAGEERSAAPRVLAEALPPLRPLRGH
ncbi:hypothetical protein GCM10007036_25440 [Alsobacter metallidurans]|uniref:Uncharacterized protein n=1 Tax=Alsobacter metallidurans TaxID=340221 RepID=A0A917I7R5_9HYPH|nr:hypothetical protein GCM10007036_25440 [Alsobacter metallidurans]